MKNLKHKLIIRNADVTDLNQINEMVGRCYKDANFAYKGTMVASQITHFKKGCFVAEINEQIVGYCATLRISGEKCLKEHSWREITGGGFGSTHDTEGEYLYGYEVCVDPEFRKFKIGQRFYNERKKLCRYLRLKGIVFAGRMPNLKKRFKEVGSVENYIDCVKNKKIRDNVLNFQLRNGFEVIGYIKDYIPGDDESMGYACHMMWKNPEFEDENLTNYNKKGYRPSIDEIGSVRVATVQYKQRKVKSVEEFEAMVTYYVDVCSEYKCDFVLFPELFTLQLLSIEPEELPHHIAIEKMAEYASELKEFFKFLALKYNINIIAGSHPVKNQLGEMNNVSFICLRDGTIHEQAKIHPTPNEKYWWNIKGGNQLKAIQTDCGPIGVLICFDSEFPELTRYLVDQGIKILFVPFLTDERKGYCRVRYCSQARAVENELYVVMSGSVGNLPNVPNIDIHYSQSCILTPCDFPFARDGIAAEATPNVEMVSFADLRIDTLVESRNTGTVQLLKNRRHDLYSMQWHGK